MPRKLGTSTDLMSQIGSGQTFYCLTTHHHGLTMLGCNVISGIASPKATWLKALDTIGNYSK